MCWHPNDDIKSTGNDVMTQGTYWLKKTCAITKWDNYANI